MSLAYVLDDIFAEHRAPRAHPERPERLLAVRDALMNANLAQRGTALEVRQAADTEIGLVHTAAYFDALARAVPGNSGWLDEDTFFSPGTWTAALSAAGAAVDVTRAVLDGQHQRGLVMARPPGHHAEADRAMGFCLFNNVAIAAAAARQAGAARVAVLDWDVHHGNGTQHIFEADPSVLFLSAHQWPFYPGTGSSEEIGTGAGRGTTINVPLPAGSGDAEYMAALDRVFVPALERFAPDLVLVSAGFDAFDGDPLAQMKVSHAGYLAMARRLVAVADRVAEGRIVFALEGGYDLHGLAGGAVAVLEALIPSAPAAIAPASGAVSGMAEQAISATLKALAPHLEEPCS